MDLPKILLTGLVFLFFLVFLEFLDSWTWDSKNLEKNQKNQSWIDLPKILLTGLVFFFFWFSSSFWTVGLGTTKNLNKNKKIHKNNPKWTCPRFFSQDWFFCFDINLGILAMKKQSRKTSEKIKRAKTQRSQRGFLLRKNISAVIE